MLVGEKTFQFADKMLKMEKKSQYKGKNQPKMTLNWLKISLDQDSSPRSHFNQRKDQDERIKMVSYLPCQDRKSIMA